MLSYLYKLLFPQQKLVFAFDIDKTLIRNNDTNANASILQSYLGRHIQFLHPKQMKPVLQKLKVSPHLFQLYFVTNATYDEDLFKIIMRKTFNLDFSKDKYFNRSKMHNLDVQKERWAEMLSNILEYKKKADDNIKKVILISYGKMSCNIAKQRDYKAIQTQKDGNYIQLINQLINQEIEQYKKDCNNDNQPKKIVLVFDIGQDLLMYSFDEVSNMREVFKTLQENHHLFKVCFVTKEIYDRDRFKTSMSSIFATDFSKDEHYQLKDISKLCGDTQENMLAQRKCDTLNYIKKADKNILNIILVDDKRDNCNAAQKGGHQSIQALEDGSHLQEINKAIDKHEQDYYWLSVAKRLELMLLGSVVVAGICKYYCPQDYDTAIGDL